MPGPLELALASFALLVVSAVWAAEEPTVRRAAAFAGCGVLWLLTNRPVEGPVLWALSSAHGLTAADLVLPAVGLAALVVGLVRHSSGAGSRRRGSATGHRRRRRSAVMPVAAAVLTFSTGVWVVLR